MTPMAPKNIDIQVRKLYSEVFIWFEVVVRDLGEWRPGFYSEFRCASHEHSGLSWGVVFRETQTKIRKQINKKSNFLKITMS